MTDIPGSESPLTELIGSIDVQAPPELHRRVQALADEASARRSPARSRLVLSSGAIGLAAIVVVLVVLFGSSSGTGQLTVERTASFALARPTMAAPAEAPNGRSELAAGVEGISFPYWDERFGWRSSGARSDDYDGRAVKTVFYSNAAGMRVGYAIVAGTPAPSVDSGSVQWIGPTPFHLTTVGGASVVSWIRDGHLCVVSGRGVPARTLLALASGHEPASA